MDANQPVEWELCRVSLPIQGCSAYEDLAYIQVKGERIGSKAIMAKTGPTDEELITMEHIVSCVNYCNKAKAERKANSTPRVI